MSDDDEKSSRKKALKTRLRLSSFFSTGHRIKVTRDPGTVILAMGADDNR